MTQNYSEVLRYIQAVYRHRYLFVIISFVVMSLVTIYSFSVPKQYKADSTVFIQKNVIDNLVKGIAITPDMNDKLRTIKYAILSRGLIERVLTDLNSKIFTKPLEDQQKYIKDLKDRTSLTISDREGYFIVSIVDNDPVFAQKFINTLVNTYVEENTSQKRNETYGANRFLKEQIEIFKNKLEKSEDAIIKFRNKQGIYFSVDEGESLKTIKDYLSQIQDIDLSMDTLQAKRTSLNKQLSTLKPTVDSIVSGSPEGSQLATMEKQLEALRLRYTDNYPEIIRLKSEIANFRTQMAQSKGKVDDSETSKMTSLNPLHQDIQEKLFEVDTEISSLLAKKNNLEKQVAKLQQELREVPANKKELGILTQERDSYRKIYQDLLARMGQSEVSKQMEIGNKAETFRIIDPAILPKVPVSPNMLKMMLMAIVGGFGCGFGVVFLLENIDDHVRDATFIKELGVDLLAVVPNIADAKEIRSTWRRDLMLVSMSSLYLLCIVGIFAYNLLLSR